MQIRYEGTQSGMDGQIQFELWSVQVPVGWATVAVSSNQDRDKILRDKKAEFCKGCSSKKQGCEC